MSVASTCESYDADLTDQGWKCADSIHKDFEHDNCGCEHSIPCEDADLSKSAVKGQYFKNQWSNLADVLSPATVLASIKREIQTPDTTNGKGKDGNDNSSDADDEYQQAMTTQEKLSKFVVPEKKYFIPKNIMYVEDYPYSTRINIILLILSWSYLGNMARIAFQALLTYENAYIFYRPGTVIWINFTSCVIMGLANNSLELWNCFLKDSKHRKTFRQIPLHTAITAGFCGCFSTFSGVVDELVYLSINGSRETPGNGYGVMQFFAVLLSQFGVCFFGLQLGQDLGHAVDTYLVPIIKPYVNVKTCLIMEYACIFLGILATIVNVILSIVLHIGDWYKRDYSVVLLFGLFGCYARFRLMELNGRLFSSWFPAGTLLVNIIGCVFISVMNLLLNGHKRPNSNELLISNPLHVFILKSLSNGFCGSISTFASMCTEIVNLGNPRYRYIYFFTTILSCFLPSFLMIATYSWTIGMSPV